VLTIFIASFAALLPPYFAKLLFDQGVALKEAKNIIIFGLLEISVISLPLPFYLDIKGCVKKIGLISIYSPKIEPLYHISETSSPPESVYLHAS
jgi:hypothetical protein